MILAIVVACTALTAGPLDTIANPLALLDKSILNPAPPSDLPEAKKNWKLFPVTPRTIDGPIPVILVHGQGSDHWGNFADWASSSADPEAAEFRARFQLWDYFHPDDGVNSAIGYSPDYPAFSESKAAYLARFIASATTEGVESDGTKYFFPAGPMALICHSQGGLVARAFLANFPDYAARVFGVVTLSSPHMGTPWATPEWLRYTINRLGFSRQPPDAALIFKGLYCDTALKDYFSTARQSDLDMAWLNYDRASGLGLPVISFRTWEPNRGFITLQLSPRDSNQTSARTLPGFADTTFEPQAPLSTNCGGLDAITPHNRGDQNLRKFFVYGGYLEPDPNWQKRLTTLQRKAVYDPHTAAIQNDLLKVVCDLMTLVPAAGADVPAGAYYVSDGFVPLQSQLMLDGSEGGLIYETTRILAWRLPARPIVLKESLILAHTLADPDRIRILPGWSHLDTVTGKYDATAKRSDLFDRVTQDLVSVAP